LNNKIVSNKRNSAIFLATILLAGGIIAFSNPSFMKEAQAQQEYYYEEMNDYERPSYYKNDNYEPREYPSYQSDNKPQYTSYGKDNNYKSKKHSGDSISLNINKLKCINNNVNINGNNNGTINVGNSGSSATGSGTDQGYLGVGSYGDNGEGYDKGYNKQKDQGFTCIINNNNTNTNVVSGGDGNVTNGDVIEPQTCEECFERFLTESQISVLIGSETLEGYCDDIESGSLTEGEVRMDLANPANDVSMATIDALIECLDNLGIFD
jgi:hypothetical protein